MLSEFYNICERIRAIVPTSKIEGQHQWYESPLTKRAIYLLVLLDKNGKRESVLWRAPIIVTTSVQFFETLGAASTGRLRKLNELPGSIVIFDEAHCQMPVQLWRVAWQHWLHLLAKDYGCRFIFASGSLIKFWEIPEIISSNVENVQPVFNKPALSKRIHALTQKRVQFFSRSEPFKKQLDLACWIVTHPGPRFVIMNTKLNAALLAYQLQQKGLNMLHLSTILAPQNRITIMERIIRKLEKKEDWTLVATSCLECGMDFPSFRTGFRQRCSLESFIQASGRDNRNMLYATSEMWDFHVMIGEDFNYNHNFNDGIAAMTQLIKEGRICGKTLDDICSLSTRSMMLQMRSPMSGLSNAKQKKAEDFVELEELSQHGDMAKNYRVISDLTLMVVVDKELAVRMWKGEKVSFHEIQMASVPMYDHEVDKFNLMEFGGDYAGIFDWGCRPYDPDCLGWMAGVVTGQLLSQKAP